MSPTSAERPDLLPPARKLEVEEQLLRITKSAAFSASPRCQQFLIYLVKQSIAGSYELLKERVIGAEVFGRDAAYDTGGDSIVRVRANDLRKRLAQYYDGAPGRDREIRIHLPTGSYVPEFSFPSSSARCADRLALSIQRSQRAKRSSAEAKTNTVAACWLLCCCPYNLVQFRLRSIARNHFHR